MLAIIIGAIRIILRNEGYSPDRIDTAIRWNYTEIKEYVEKETSNG